MFESNLRQGRWKKSRSDFFWGEIAVCDHILHVYKSESDFVNVLFGFVQSGLEDGEGVILFATDEHLKLLHEKLNASGIDYGKVINTHYFPMDAYTTLSKFIVQEWPDEKLFMEFATALLKKVRGYNRKIRAFGEMVAVLMETGNKEATIELERLWNKFCEMELFCLYCAYPTNCFGTDQPESFQHICSSHTKVLAPQQPSSLDVLYSRRLQLDNTVK